MLSNYNLRTVMTNVIIIGLHFLLHLIKFLMNFYEILGNNRINIFLTIFQKISFFPKKWFRGFFFNVSKKMI